MPVSRWQSLHQSVAARSGVFRNPTRGGSLHAIAFLTDSQMTGILKQAEAGTPVPQKKALAIHKKAITFI